MKVPVVETEQEPSWEFPLGLSLNFGYGGAGRARGSLWDLQRQQLIYNVLGLGKEGSLCESVMSGIDLESANLPLFYKYL